MVLGVIAMRDEPRVDAQAGLRPPRRRRVHGYADHAIFADMGTTELVTLNAMRLLAVRRA